VAARKRKARFDVSALLGKRVRIWLSKNRGEGKTIEGVVNYAGSSMASFPDPDGRCNWVISCDGKRVLDVFEKGRWQPLLPLET
jgi:hypothetical protein